MFDGFLVGFFSLVECGIGILIAVAVPRDPLNVANVRRDPTNFRPRINKEESVKDREQKLSGNYFVLED